MRARLPINVASRHLRRGWLWPALTLLVVGLLVADRRGWLLVRDVDDLAAYHGRTARVSRVIDGDTIEVALRDDLNHAPQTRVRLWGINCPELAHFGGAEQPLAREAKDLALHTVGERDVMLFLEPQRPRDSFGRVLAHIETTDGRSLNEALLEAGLARADDRWPHTRLTRYAQVELAARRKGVGMWAKAAKPAATQAAAHSAQ